MGYKRTGDLITVSTIVGSWLVFSLKVIVVLSFPVSFLFSFLVLSIHNMVQECDGLAQREGNSHIVIIK